MLETHFVIFFANKMRQFPREKAKAGGSIAASLLTTGEVFAAGNGGILCGKDIAK